MGYHGTAATVGGATATALPFTGLPLVWALVAGFALLAAGLAIVRVLPRSQA